MSQNRASTRTSRTVRARPEEVYAAFTDPEALAGWLPPGGMTGKFHAFDGRVGGGYTMSLFYPQSERDRGKTSERERIGSMSASWSLTRRTASSKQSHSTAPIPPSTAR